MQNVLFFLTPKCDVVYVYEDSNIRQVLEKIRFHKYTAMPIISREGKYVGTITEGDLLWKMADENVVTFEQAEEIPISDIKRRVNNQPVNAEARMESLIDLAIRQNFVPVVDDDNVFIGIVTRKDIIQYLYKKCTKQN
ncbi:MAG: CBS domain-containing protein [Lachnospiraceae bacterium]